MRTDVDIIGEAYAQQVRNAWHVLFEEAVNGRSEQELTGAEERFVTGVRLARSVRDRAVELLQQPLDVPRTIA